MPIRDGDVFRRVESAAHPVMIHDVLKEPGWQQVEWLPKDQSWMGVPLFSKDQVIGMISLPGVKRLLSARMMPCRLQLLRCRPPSRWKMLACMRRSPASTNISNKWCSSALQELNQALHSLERLDKNKSDFIGVAAHELRTPLTVMKGYMGMMESDPNIKNNLYLSQSVNGVVKGIERLHEIVNSMLDVVRIESQILDMNTELTSIATIVKRVKADVEDVLAERQLIHRYWRPERPTTHSGRPGACCSRYSRM